MTAPIGLPSVVWHVTLILSGAPAPLELLRHALERLCARDPLNMGARFRADQVELQFWDEGRDIADVAVAAAQLWRISRQDTGLPDWSLVGLEVMDRDRWRHHGLAQHQPIRPGSVAALR